MRILPYLLLLISVEPAAAGGGDAPLRIGIPETFFHDMSKALIRESTDPFADVLRETTGLRGEPVTDGDPFTVAQNLEAGKFQLGVLHGFEYAWIRDKHPDLVPLMIAVRTGQDQRAYLVVRKDDPAAAFAALKGKDLSVPKRTKAHCRLYVERMCQREGARGIEDFFGRIVRSPDIESALDDLARGKGPAVLIDAGGLDFYKDLRPGVFARLKVLAQSDTFPPLVLAYKKGALSDATLTRIREGLPAAAKTGSGRDMMKLWRITAFEPVPPDFGKTLAASLKAYPAPEKK
jgi:ABC-type phosphate/phosphonate transport system substrate-binding protein